MKVKKYDYFELAIEDQPTEIIDNYNEARRRYSSVQGSATLYGVNEYYDMTVILAK